MVLGHYVSQKKSVFSRYVCFFIFLTIAMSLFFSLFAHGATLPGEDLAIKQKKQEAITLLQSGDMVGAYSAFMILLREDPSDADINMGLALSAHQLKNYPQALMAYERLLALFPRDSKLRLELARVYVALGEPESAKLELEKAKKYDSSITDSAVAEILDSLTKKPSRWSHQGRISSGVIYDSNSNQGPQSNQISLGLFENLYVAGVKEKASWGNYLMGSFESGYRLGENSRWWLMGDVMGYQRWNTSAGVKTNKGFSFGRGALGMRYIGESALFDMRMKVDIGNQHHKVGEDQHIFSFGPELTFVYVPKPYLQFITSASIDARRYSVAHGQEGHYWSVGQFVRVFFGEANHEVMGGVAFTGSDTRVNAYGYNGVEPSLRFVFKLPYDVSISPFISFREEVYGSPATGLERIDRIDDQWKMGAGVGWNITKSLSLDASYQYLKNRSTSELYQYDQDMVNVGLTFKF